MKMKKIILFLLVIFITNNVIAQSDPVLSIDGVNTTFKSGLSLPYWLKGGQTVSLITGVKSASILEFTEDNGNLKYSQTISLTTTQTVPVGKVWKIEGLGLGINGTTISGFSNSSIPTIFTSPKVFSTSGTYTWKVPPSVTNICVEVWGGGASGSIYGGGGGGYGYQCFTVIPGTEYTIIVGSGGDGGAPSIQQSYGGASSFGTLISATGGSPTLSVNVGGVGGSSNASYNLMGGIGSSVGSGGSASGAFGANGGSGGINNGGYGSSPGGGGGGNSNFSNNQGGGGVGQVKIYW